MKLRLAMLMMLLVGTSAVAGEGHEGGPAGMMGGDRTMFRAGGMGTIGTVSDRPSIGIAYLPIDHMMVSAAVYMTYNGNTLGALNPTGLSWIAGMVLVAEYMIVDQMPFAMGPAFAFSGSFAPGDFFSQVTLIPAWDLWYTPFNAPLAIGTALAVSIQLNKGAEPVISLLTPGLRIAYTF